MSLRGLLLLVCVGGCVDGAVERPARVDVDVDVDSDLPGGSFAGVDADGVVGEFSFADIDAGRLVVQVHGGAWCGTCRALAVAEADDDLFDDDVVRVDVVLADADNGSVDVDDAVAWHDEFAVGAAVFADPGFALQPLLADAGSVLPLVVVVDDGRVVSALSNPSLFTLRAALGHVDHAPVLVDGRLTPQEWALLQTTTLPEAPPPDRSNAVADDVAAAAFGAAAFADAGFSPSGAVSCASCHDRARAYSDGRRHAVGVAEGARRAPSIALAAHNRWQFWDGRADSLWSQALGPFENPAEMGSSRLFVARRVVAAHADAYRRAFPDHALPDVIDDDADDDAVTRVFVDTGKAIAAYERTFRVQANRFDAYLGGDAAALADDEKLGLVLFARSGCQQCHWGPRLTDDAFHAVSLGGAASVDADDRFAGHAAWRASPFRRHGIWSDDVDDAAEDEADDVRRRGQQKTPALRGVADLSFFTHDGGFDDLNAVMGAYGLAARHADDGAVREPWLPFFGETAQWGLVPFLQTLTATPR